MRKSGSRRAAVAPAGRNRRLFAAGAVIAAVGAAIGFTTISNAAEGDRPVGSGVGKVVNGQVILTDTCVDSTLTPHDGFQNGGRCVSTEFGEVGAAASNPTLLITQAPQRVRVNQPFTLKVSTRNLIRDRFLAAGKGGYYVESSVLQNGLVRGHFHTACRMLDSTGSAPAPEPVPAFFVATEDRKGGAGSDEVSIQVPGLPKAGIAQCASWAGDGSHRIPMMERANQTPALDAVRITVGGPANQSPGNQNGTIPGGSNPGGSTPGGSNPTTPPRNGATPAPTNSEPRPVTTTKPKTTTSQRTTTTGDSPEQTSEEDQTDPQARADQQAQAGQQGLAAEQVGTQTAPGASTNRNATDLNASERDTANRTDPEPSAGSKTAGSKTAGGAQLISSNDDGQFNSGNSAPVPQQVAEVQAAQEQAVSADKDGSALARTGNNTMAAIGGAAVLLLIGLIVMAFTRKRRPGITWR